MVTLTLASAGLRGLSDRTELLAPWALTIIGSGLLGSWIRKLGKSPAGSRSDEQYEAARRLLGQLRTLARHLPSGLDPVAISEEILELAHQRLGDEYATVFIRAEGGAFISLGHRGPGAAEHFDPNDPRMSECWRSSRPVHLEADPSERLGPCRVYLPLRVGAGTLGVLATHDPKVTDRGRMDSVLRELDDLCLRLDTALAFDEVRSLVTADERQRLAREIHDGIAQEVASLGYMVDEIRSKAVETDVVSGLGQLRSELSRIISELRLSIFDLRANVAASGGLGSALSEHARRIGRQSGITVHLTLDEGPVRLTPMVETELLRIAQEAITNARKHSGAQNLWIQCQVRSPSAVIQIHDDGRGLGIGRKDSFGLKIMRERAERIGARLTVAARNGASGLPGTCVTIKVGNAIATPATERIIRWAT
jgi:signal transduction histidine kinase